MAQIPNVRVTRHVTLGKLPCRFDKAYFTLNQIQIEYMTLNGDEDNKITFEEGAVMTAKYRGSVPAGSIIANCYSRDSIQTLLDQPGCKGIRAYFALNADKLPCLVIVGVNESGNDQIGPDYNCMDNSTPCPIDCSEPNILNS